MYVIYALLIVAICIFLYYSEYNTLKFKVNDNSYRVHTTFPDKHSAAETLAEINNRLLKLKIYMKKKYQCAGSCTTIIKSGLDDFRMDERSEQFEDNFKPQNISEISPHNPLGSTSFTEGKGTKIVFCIRDRDTNQIHDINTLMFVALHEITHVMNEKWGHGVVFWELFAIVLRDAAECGIYQPVDYSQRPQTYCGIKITSNPYFNFSITK